MSRQRKWVWLTFELAAASQVVTPTTLEILEINSFIWGYHAYRDVWEPTTGEILLAKPEPSNVRDKSAVAVFKDGSIVGHVPVFKKRSQQGFY